jgi:hypothetical protein
MQKEIIMRSRRAQLRFLPLVLGIFLFCSCAASIKHYPHINQCLLKEDYDSAWKLVQKSREEYPKRNAVLYYLDEGITLHLAGRYQESNESFSRAESIMDELFTKSLSKEAASFLISDNTVPYRGEDFERAMANLFMALNYAALSAWDDSLVEARKVDSKLTVINASYDEDKKNVYKEDGFIRFLMGTLYEAGGELNDAFISYRKAEEIYRDDYLPNYGVRPPEFLIQSLLTAAKGMGFYQEMEEIQSKYPRVVFGNPSEKRGMAEVFFIHYNGIGPEKVEDSFITTMPDGYVMKMAFPRFVKKNFRISHGEITLRNQEQCPLGPFPTVLMEDIGAIATTNLDNRINRIRAKAVARATTKYLASKAAEKAAKDQGGDFAGLFVKLAANVASVATEQADIRHWRLLPAEIRVGRTVLPPGEYSGEIDFVDSSGAILGSKVLEPFSVRAGEKKFCIFRTLN